MEIHAPVDGMPADAPVVKVYCPCGEFVSLWWNGGELDRDVCKCGTVYRTENVGTVLRVN